LTGSVNKKMSALAGVSYNVNPAGKATSSLEFRSGQFLEKKLDHATSNPALLSQRRRAFWGHLRATDVLGTFHLKRIINDKSYSPWVRAAALRNLTCQAPLDVTLGRPYAERRRLVRKHYNV
jgi:hypothetical protein